MWRRAGGPQNGMFATTHVTHNAYDHMCFQQRIGVEEDLAYTAAERRSYVA
jgi:hypothetical protein